MATEPDLIADALEHTADAAEAAAADQRRAAGVARRTARAQRRGDRAAQLSDVTRVLDLITNSAQQLLGASGKLRRAAVRQLSAEGTPVREIARRLGISHQRVSVLRRINHAGDVRSTH